LVLACSSVHSSPVALRGLDISMSATTRWATPMLPSFARPYGTDLRQAAIDGLEGLRPAAQAALMRERESLISKRERGLLYATAITALATTHQRVGTRAAAVIFLVSRLATAALSRRPDPRQLLLPRVLLNAAGRTSTLIAEAVGLMTFSALLAACAITASLELLVRAMAGAVHARCRLGGWGR
jgi:hypothetical protein